MTLNRQQAAVPQYTTAIKVIGIGGAGCNAVNRMLDARIAGAEFYAVNTDLQALGTSRSPNTLQIGRDLTRGLGAGADPEIGRKAAEESRDDIHSIVDGADLVFVAAGMGGGTGTGASPLIADVARETGALTVGVVTKPFQYEGRRKAQIAERGVQELEQKVDALIVIPNERIYSVIERNTPFLAAFNFVDDVLRQGIQGITDLITQPGLINLDFADVRRVMSNAGSALIGIGSSNSEHRAAEAAQKAISNPLLEAQIDGARGAVFNIYGGPELTMFEVNEAAQEIVKVLDQEAEVIFGATVVDGMTNEVRVTVIATGFGPRARDQQRVVGVGEMAKVEPVKMEEIEVPAFLRYSH